MMMNHPDFAKHDCRTLKKILFGGHAASETFINQLKACFDPVAMVNGGSVSESTALGFALPTEDAIRKITSCGLVVSGELLVGLALARWGLGELDSAHRRIEAMCVWALSRGKKIRASKSPRRSQ